MIGRNLNQFRIVEAVGAGGMGIVYRARDEKLERDVAIKVLTAGTLADNTARARFRKEALTLSRLNHPNIATIFDFDTAGDTDFLVTEYITGRTLDTLLADGPSPAKQVISLGIQLTQGMAAAHSEGIVHRDLKPGNLRLTADGRLKILDFGLAQLIQAENVITRTVSFTTSQQITGTLPYMAPEQLRGEPVDARCDIWACGAVLYEMATGQRPFPETNGPLLINAILNRTPEPPIKINPKVPPGLDHIIRRALEKNPVERYQSSRELSADLERLTAGVAPLQLSRSRWRWFAAAAVLVLLAAALTTFFLKHERPANFSGPSGVRRSVAVLGFKNLSGRSDTAWLSTALAEMLTTELAAGEKLRTISGENVARVKNDLSVPETDTLAPDTLSRIRKNLGSDFVVLGSYLDLGGGSEDQIRLDLRVQYAIAGQTIAIVSDKGTLADLDGLVTHAGAQLRERLGIGAVAPSDETAARATRPANIDASRYYASGLEKMRTFDTLAARDLFLKAVAADPQHAGSYAMLSAAWRTLGYDGKARDAARRAVDLSAHLPRDERLLVEGQFYDVTDQGDKAISTYRSLFEAQPDNLDYGLKLANMQVSGGKPNDALTTIGSLRRLPAPQRDDLRIDLVEARAAHFLSDFKREQALAASVADQGEKLGARFLVARARQAQCLALRNLGDPNGAIPACQAAQKISEAAGDQFGVATALNSPGNALYDTGDLAAARRAYENAVTIDRAIGNQSNLAGALDNIASLVGDQGDSETAKRLSEQALAIYRETDDKINIAATLNNIAAELVTEGDLTGTEKLFEESLAIGREINSDTAIATALTNIGDLRLQLGDSAGSQKAYAESLATFDKNGETGKSAYPLAGLGDVMSATGDLEGARSYYERALAITKTSGEKHQAAVALSGLGNVLLQQANLAEARKRLSDALALRKELQEKDGIAESELDLARLNLEDGRQSESESALRDLASRGRAEKMYDLESSARSLLAVALARQGKGKQPEEQIALARTVVARSQRKSSHFEVEIAAVLVSALSAKTATTGAAVAQLDTIVEEAQKRGLRKIQFEARLALAEIDRKSNAGTARASALQKDAETKGFLLIARKAKSLQN